MSRLVEANLPLYVESLCAPTQWRIDRNRRAKWREDQQEGDILNPLQIAGIAKWFDPWEKRTEFFRLRRGDTEALLAFLPTVGLFESAFPTAQEKSSAIVHANTGRGKRAKSGAVDTVTNSYQVSYKPELNSEYVWHVRDLFVHALQQGGEVSEYDFQVSLSRINGQPKVIFTTTTFVDALMLTLQIDRVEGARVRKCSRPDCPAVFSYTSGGHKRKYCCWYCGHIESVRRNREQKRKHKGGAHGK